MTRQNPSSKNKIPLAWTKGLDPKQKEDFERTLRGNRFLLERLTMILDGMDSEAEAQMLGDTIWENPNWPYKQADLTGFRRALKKIKELL